MKNYYSSMYIFWVRKTSLYNTQATNSSQNADLSCYLALCVHSNARTLKQRLFVGLAETYKLFFN